MIRQEQSGTHRLLLTVRKVPTLLDQNSLQGYGVMLGQGAVNLCPRALEISVNGRRTQGHHAGSKVLT
jgi:hypothetical protein